MAVKFFARGLFSTLLDEILDTPLKDHVNVQLTRAMMGTTQLRVVVCEMLRPVTPKRAGKSGAKWRFNATVSL